MPVIHINIKNKVATCSLRDPIVVCDNTDYTVKFTFDQEWDGVTTKTARFTWNGQYTDVSFMGNECIMPAVTNTTECTIGVYGGDLSTSTPAKIPCRLSVLCGFPVERAENIWLRKLIEGTLTEITPEMLTGVTEIRECAFQNYSSLTSIVIPEGVKRIYASAFWNCGNLKKLSIPDSVDYFDKSSIYGDMTSVPYDSYYVDEDGSEYLGNDKNHYVVLLYLNSSNINQSVKVLTNESCNSFPDDIISLPESLQGIMGYAVYCSNESISIGKNLTYLNAEAFNSSSNLKEIVVDEANKVYSSDSGIVYDKEKTEIVAIPRKIEYVVIPDTCEVIKKSQVRNFTSLISVVIGTGVTSIGMFAFAADTSLTSVEYRGQVLLSDYIFYNCSKITKYDFRNATSVPTLANRSYLGHAAGCKIIVPDSLLDSWKAATNWTALTNVVWVKASEYTEG